MTGESPVKIISVDWASCHERLSLIRRRVFIDEQQVPEDMEWDEHDPVSVHFLVIDSRRVKHTDIACARLAPSGKIGRMAVLKPWRRQGIGFRLLEYVVAHARKQGLSGVYLHAQVSAIGLYQKAGFSMSGDEFDEAGIAHRQMHLQFD